MNRSINWLTERKYISFLLLSIYYLMVVLPHEQVGQFVVWVFKEATRATYQITVAVLGSGIFLVFLFYIFQNIKHLAEKRILYLYLFTTVTFMLISFKTLIIHNIEIIHYAQYAILILFLYPLTKTMISSLFWATILGALDEAYQYLYLAPNRTDYFDFNDIILDLLGAAFGIIWIYSFYQNNIGGKHFKKQINIIISAVIIIVIIVTIGVLTSNLYIYPVDNINLSAIVLVKKIEPNFWSHITHLNVKYHIVQPLEGLIVISLLLFFYFLLEYFGIRKKDIILQEQNTDN